MASTATATPAPPVDEAADAEPFDNQFTRQFGQPIERVVNGQQILDMVFRKNKHLI